MTRRAFDTRGNLADQLFRCLETPYSDVLEHSAVPATFGNGPQTKVWGPLLIGYLRSFRGSDFLAVDIQGCLQGYSPNIVRVKTG